MNLARGQQIELPQGITIAPALVAGDEFADSYLEAARNTYLEYPTANRTIIGRRSGELASAAAFIEFDGLFEQLPEDVSTDLGANKTSSYHNEEGVKRTYGYGAQEIGAVSLRADGLTPFPDLSNREQRSILYQLLLDSIGFSKIADAVVPTSRPYSPFKNIAASSPKQAIEDMQGHSDLELRFRGHYLSGGWLFLAKTLGK